MRFGVLLLGLACFTTAGTARAVIIDIDAVTNTADNRVSVFLTAGTYVVTPIGTAEGGAFNAWDANIFDGPNGQSWLHDYWIDSSEFGPDEFRDFNFYTNELDALANAVGTSFTLTSDSSVDFYIMDNPYTDNAGGVSLSVVPEPSITFLFGIGLAGLTWHGRSNARRWL